MLLELASSDCEMPFGSADNGQDMSHNSHSGVGDRGIGQPAGSGQVKTGAARPKQSQARDASQHGQPAADTGRPRTRAWAKAERAAASARAGTSRPSQASN
jgi:hypothetical protein